MPRGVRGVTCWTADIPKFITAVSRVAGSGRLLSITSSPHLTPMAIRPGWCWAILVVDPGTALSTTSALGFTTSRVTLTRYKCYEDVRINFKLEFETRDEPGFAENYALIPCMMPKTPL